MSKSHVVYINIINNTQFDFTFSDDWFDSGRLADDNNWPGVISAGQAIRVECYEKDWSIGTGCSGWVKYSSQGQDLFFAFSNPSVGLNGIDFGLNDNVWNSMTGQYNNGISVALPINANNLFFVGQISSTSGDVNEAVWNVNYVDVAQPVLQNLTVDNVLETFNGVSNVGSRKYYKCDNAPTLITGLIKSHFKGISAFQDRLIFSHTNLDIVSTENGKYMIADEITISDQGSTELTVDTDHPGWLHPCSSQACGTLMALGIQESADNPSNTSEIQIYDATNTLANYPMRLLGTIPRSNDGINGVGMTRVLTGEYLVAAVNGSNLTIYQSTTTDLLNGFPNFMVILEITDFSESGAGLALITQTNGDIYLIGLNAEDNGSNNHMSLFSVDLANRTVTQVATQQMPIPGVSDTISFLEAYIAPIIIADPIIGAALEVLLNTYGTQYLNSSFRWGKGVLIKDSSTLEIYATDRNVIPLSHIPLSGFTGLDKDFSLVTWSNNITK